MILKVTSLAAFLMIDHPGGKAAHQASLFNTEELRKSFGWIQNDETVNLIKNFTLGGKFLLQESLLDIVI